MGSTTKPQKHTIRGRWVKRAKNLKGRRDFKVYVETARQEWDATHPQFAIGVPGDIREMSEWTHGGTYPSEEYPATLKAARHAFYPTGPTHKSEEFRAVYTADLEWRQLVRKGCNHFWPYRSYPNWHNDGSNPAVRFYSACLLYKIDTVPTELIETYTGTPVLYAYPVDPDTGLIYGSSPGNWALFISLVRSLEELEAQGRIDKAWVDAQIEQAFERMRTAVQERPEITKRFLYVYPGMTKTELMEMVPDIIWQVNSLGFSNMETGLDDQISQLSNDGWGNLRIATALGIDPRTVAGRRRPQGKEEK